MKVKIWSIIGVLILLIQLAAEAYLGFVMLRLNMLPDMYIVLLIGILVVVWLFTGFFLLVGKRKTAGRTVRRIIGVFLAVLTIAGCAVLAKVVSDAQRTVDEVTKPAPTTNARNMYIFVRVDDPAQTLQDTANYSFGIIADYDEEHTQQAVVQIGEAIGKIPEVKEYIGSKEIADALYAGELDAAIMNGVSITLLLEQEGYEDFTEKCRILTTMSLESLQVTQAPTEPVETEPTEPEANITNTPFVVYISGSDTRSKILNTSRSDVNILMVVNPVTKQVLLVNTPRDYYVPNPAGYGRLDKLTHCGIYGIDCSIGSLSEVYGITVDYYGQINFTGVETLVNAVGGVRVYSDTSFTACGVPIQAGWNNMDGATALAFSRERYHVAGGDNGRGKHQMKVIKAIIEKMTNGTTIISNYSSILQSLEGMFKTNITSEEISLLVKMQLSDMKKWDVHTIAVTGTGGSDITYSMPGYYAYVMYPHQSSVDHASELMNRVLAGDILTEEDLKT